MRAFVAIVLSLGCGVTLAGQPVTDSSGHKVKDSHGHVVHSSSAKCKGWTADSAKVTADSSCTADGGKAKKHSHHAKPHKAQQ